MENILFEYFEDFLIHDLFMVISLESNAFHLVVDVLIKFSKYVHWICEGRKIFTQGMLG